MAFSDAFAKPTTSPPQTPSSAPAPVPKGGGFASVFATPTSPVARVAPLKREAAVAAEQARVANSPRTIIANAIPKLSEMFGGVKEIARDVVDVIKEPTAPKSFNPIVAGREAAKAAEETFLTTVQDAGDRLYRAATTIQDDHATALQKGVAVGEAGLGALNSLFTAVSAPMAYATRIPVVGNVADAVNKFFGAIGTVGADGAEGLVEALPLTPDAKATLTPLAKEIGNLSAQIIAGKVSGDAFGAVTNRSQQFLKGVDDAVRAGKYVTEIGPVRDVPVKGESVAEPVIPSNRYTPDAELPVIEMGSKPRGTADTLPTVEELGREKAAVPRETVVEPVRRPNQAAEMVVEDITAPSVRPQNVPESMIVPETPEGPLTASGKPRAGTVRPVEGTGEVKTRGLSEGIEAKAIENGLTDSFGQLPEYRVVDMADQAARAARIIERDPQLARDIALGKKRPPADVLPESVLVAVEKKAIAEGDVQTLRELASNSRLTYEATTMGQRIRTLAERDPSSPVGAIKAIQDAREAAIKKRNVDVDAETVTIIDDIKTEVRKTAASKTRPTWEQFIGELTCKI